jgi:hypothetical protein
MAKVVDESLRKVRVFRGPRSPKFSAELRFADGTSETVKTEKTSEKAAVMSAVQAWQHIARGKGLIPPIGRYSKRAPSADERRDADNERRRARYRELNPLAAKDSTEIMTWGPAHKLPAETPNHGGSNGSNGHAIGLEEFARRGMATQAAVDETQALAWANEKLHLSRRIETGQVQAGTGPLADYVTRESRRLSGLANMARALEGLDVTEVDWILGRIAAAYNIAKPVIGTLDITEMLK